jgi:F-type H+-transporting ATPase subunit a
MGKAVSFNMDTLITMWASMILLIILALLTTRKLDLIPSKLQLFGENIIKYFNDIANASMGNDNAQKHIAIILTLFMFILTANLVGQLPLKLFHLTTGQFAKGKQSARKMRNLSLCVIAGKIAAIVWKK